MKTILFFILIYSNVCAANYDAKNITKKDFAALQKLDKKLYDLAAQKNIYLFSKVSNYIYKNLAYKLDYSLWKVNAKGSLRYVKNLNDNSASQFTRQGSRGKAEILATYPIWDEKEKKERKKKRVETKQRIITQIRKYFEIKANLHDLEIQKLIFLQLEIRAKSRKLTAVGGFDDWLKVINDIRKINADITDAEIKLSEAKQILISFVKPIAIDALNEML